jgi:hypothetical protein
MCVNQQPDKTDAQHEFNSSGHYLAYDSKHASEWRWGLQHALEREGTRANGDGVCNTHLSARAAS